jgi:magnesium chelatase family protein
MHIEVMAVSATELREENKAEDSAAIRARVLRARELQTERFRSSDKVHNNAQMSSAMIKKYCRLEDDAVQLLISALQNLQLSGRAHDRILKVSRTIADLDDGSETIRFRHVSEAIGYRSLDKESWMDQATAKDRKKNDKRNVYKVA